MHEYESLAYFLLAKGDLWGVSCTPVLPWRIRLKSDLSLFSSSSYFLIHFWISLFWECFFNKSLAHKSSSQGLLLGDLNWDISEKIARILTEIALNVSIQLGRTNKIIILSPPILEHSIAFNSDGTFLIFLQ